MIIPAVLVLCGVAALWLAIVRRRLMLDRPDRGRAAARIAGRAALAGYAVIGLSTLALAGVEIVQRGTVYWHARWDEGSRSLVLERWGPIPDVRVAKDQVATITEFSNRELSLTGRRRTVRFMLQTSDGATFWSAPLTRKEDVAGMRETLITATDRRLQRFIVGHPGLESRPN